MCILGLERRLLQHFAETKSGRFSERLLTTRLWTASSNGLLLRASILMRAGRWRFPAIASTLDAKKICSMRSRGITASRNFLRRYRNGPDTDPVCLPNRSNDFWEYGLRATYTRKYMQCKF